MPDEVVLQGYERLFRRFERLLRGIHAQDLLGDIGAFLVHSITVRTQEQGDDIYGVPFTPYSLGYELFLEREGYSTEVDLTFTESMFASLTFEASHDQVRVFFMPGQDKSGVSNPAKAFYLQDEREFFGYTDEDVERILDIYRVNIEGVLRGD